MLVLGILGITLFTRIFWIQIVRKDYYKHLSNRQSVVRNVIKPQRGQIFDRHHRPLVVNSKVPISAGKDKKNRDRTIQRVSLYGSLAGQILGNINNEGKGQTGLEYHQEKHLRGTEGWQYFRVNASRRSYPSLEDQSRQPVHGKHIVTTLDVDIQKIAERELAKGVERTQAINGIAIVMDPYTGDILANAVYPFYNPNRRSSQGMDYLKNLSISKVYEPGSTFKIITSAVALESNIIGLNDSIYGEKGEYEIEQAIIRDTRKNEMLSLKDALAYSSNIAMVKLAQKINPVNFYKYIRAFGFGNKTGVFLPGEEIGVLKKVPEWNTRTQVTMSWGQEIGVTPLQLLSAVNCIANDGLLLKPRIVLEYQDHDGWALKKNKPVKIRRVISKQTAQTMRQLLTGVVEYGTAKNIQSSKYSIAGKTGTVEKINKETGEYVHGKLHSSFVGMAPVDKPQYTILVLINEPQVNKYGSQSAAPIFKGIMDRIITLKPIQSINTIVAQDTFTINKAQIGDLKKVVKTTVPTNNTSILMPNLKGYSLKQALKKLEKVKCKKLNYQGIGRVFEQSPQPKASILNSNNCYLKLK